MKKESGTPQNRYHEKLKRSGLIRRAYYATPENHKQLKELANKLSKPEPPC